MKQLVNIFIFTGLLCSCYHKEKETLKTIFMAETNFSDSCTTNKVKTINDDYFTRVDGKNVFSAGIVYYIPVKMPTTMMRVYVDFDCRKGGEDFGQSLIVSLQKGDSIVEWKKFPLAGMDIGEKVWVHISDSTQFLYKNPFHKPMQVKVFAFDRHKKSYMEMNKLKVVIKEVNGTEGKKEPQNKNIVFSKFIDFEDSLIKPRTTGCAFSGKYFARVDGKIIYGGGTMYELPAELNTKKLVARLNYFCRTVGPDSLIKMIVAVQNDDTLLVWKDFSIRKYKMRPGTWTNITDTVQFNYDAGTKKNMQLRVFAYNLSKEAFIDIDDLYVELEKKSK